MQSIRGIVELCVSNEALRKDALEDVRDALAAAVDVSSLRAVPDPYASSAPTSPSKPLADVGHILAGSPSLAPTESILDRSTKYLAFLKVLLWTPSAEACKLQEGILTSLLTLVRSQSRLSASSLEALAALFTSLSMNKVQILPDCHPATQDQQDHTLSFRSQMWSSIKTLMSAAKAPGPHRTAFALWLRWIALPEAYRPSQQILQKDAYWEMLQVGLRNGLSEQQKLCLHILKGSLTLLETDIETRHFCFRVSKLRHAYTAQYNKYCTVFETVVLSRYPNQVEECLPDLQALGKTDAKIHTSWYMVLLETALRPGIQDGIRNLIGGWVIGSDVQIHEVSAEIRHFVTEAFLPWATQGFLFTTSTRTVGSNVRCDHGDRLSAFLVHSLQNSGRNPIDPSPVESLRKTLVTEVLQYIHLKGGRLVAHAAVYLLDGLVKAVESTDTPIELETVPLILKVASRTGLPEAARDFCLAHCVRLCRLTGLPSDQLADAIPGYRMSDAAFQDLQRPMGCPDLGVDATTSSITQSPAPSLREFLIQLKDTQHRCLADTGLASACKYLRDAMDRVNADLQPDDALLAFQAVWDEVEVQEFPKHALIEVPTVFFHPVCVEACPEGHALSGFLRSVMTQLQHLCGGRIYVFSPLLSSIRRAYLEAPEAAQVIPLDDLLTHFADHPPKPKVEFLLESATVSILRASLPHRTYESYYGKHEGYGYACAFDLLNRLVLSDPQTTNRLLQRLIRPWATQEMPVPMVSKWKTTVQLQTILILSNSPAFTQSHVDQCMKALAIEPLPRHRYLLEWIVVRALLRYPDTSKELLAMLDPADESNPKYMASVLKMAVMVARSPGSPVEYSERLMTLLVPLAASPKIIIRHEAHWSFPVLWDHVSANGWTGMTGNPAFAALNRHIRNLDRYQNPPPGRMLEWLDPVEDHTLTHLFQGRYLRVDPPEAEVVTSEDFEAVWADDTAGGRSGQPLPPAHMPLGDVSARTIRSQASQEKPPRIAPPATAEPASAPASSAPLQTKGTAWQDQLRLADPAAARRSTDLIVVASLIDNATNLGGLSRCAEVFGAAALHVRSLAALQSRDFAAVAVSSERHLPIRELPLAGLARFLRDSKRDGCAVVGVEQTDRSVVLGEPGARLPRRCVLVLGSEREGIPGWLLAECDLCVEVRQVGVTRSLNVQTAASVVLYEYGRQHGGRAVAA